jgi:hypothetical protein
MIFFLVRINLKSRRCRSGTAAELWHQSCSTNQGQPGLGSDPTPSRAFQQVAEEIADTQPCRRLVYEKESG